MTLHKKGIKRGESYLVTDPSEYGKLFKYSSRGDDWMVLRAIFSSGGIAAWFDYSIQPDEQSAIDLVWLKCRPSNIKVVRAVEIAQ